jgi:hypothetical protein
MALNDSNRQTLLQQYKEVRGEIDKSVFIQYEVIRIGALVLGSLLVFIPASFTAFAGGNPALLAVTLVCLAFISLSFVFIMGAGEIRIVRAAAFCNWLLESLLRDGGAVIDETLLWDNFVIQWNAKFLGKSAGWNFRERVYLAMPFLTIAALADVGAAVSLGCAVQTGRISPWFFVLFGVTMVIQATLYYFPARLSRRLAKTLEK